MTNLEVLPILLFFVSSVTCGLIIVASNRVPRLSGRVHDLNSVQASHVKVTPRVGGLGLFIALVIGMLLTTSQVFLQYQSVIFAVTILFVVGLAEDLGWYVKPMSRLMAAVCAALVVMLMKNVWVTSLDWSGIDPWMESGVLGIPLTIFAIVGVTNAFNLIDGVNGLAGFTAVVCATCLGVIAQYAGAIHLTDVAFLISITVLGFLFLNFPFGLIFLGDAGAYCVGFVLGWLGVYIAASSSEVTVWALLLTMLWPIFDTLLAIYRRGLRKAPTMLPDRLHVHQLVMRALEIVWLGRSKRHIANPLTTVVLAPLVLLPALFGIYFWNNPSAAFMSFVGIMAAYFVLYTIMVHVVRSRLFKRAMSEVIDAT